MDPWKDHADHNQAIDSYCVRLHGTPVREYVRSTSTIGEVGEVLLTTPGSIRFTSSSCQGHGTFSNSTSWDKETLNNKLTHMSLQPYLCRIMRRILAWADSEWSIEKV